MYYNPYGPQNYGTRQEIIKVNGEAGAHAFMLPPNSSCLALDANAPVVYLLQSDAGGYKTCNAYTITPVQKQEQMDLANINRRLTNLEAMINESNFSGIKRPAESHNKQGKPAQKPDARESAGYISDDDGF